MKTFNIYREDLSNQEGPVAIATGLYNTNYSDNTAKRGVKYKYTIGCVVDGREIINKELLSYKPLESSYIFDTSFKSIILDRTDKTWTAVGGPIVTYSGAVLVSDANTKSYFVTNIQNFDRIFSTNDFTIRVNVCFNTLTGTNIIVSGRDYPQRAGFWFGTYNGNLRLIVHNGTQTAAVDLEGVFNFKIGQFYSISLERKDNKYYIYCNGVLIKKHETASTIKKPTSGSATIGALSDDLSYGFNGVIRSFELLNEAIGSGLGYTFSA